MQLEALEAVPYSLPFRELYATASGQLRERELVLVRVRGEGLEGLGETASLSLRGGPGVRKIAREIESVCWPAIADAGFEPHRIWSALARCRSRGASAQAIAARGHRAARPGRQGERPAGLATARAPRRRARSSATRRCRRPTRRRCERWPSAGRGTGFDTFKLKVGLAGDVAQVATVREVIGPEAQLRVDANGGLVGRPWRSSASGRWPGTPSSWPSSRSRGWSRWPRCAARRDVRLAADEDVVTTRDARRGVRAARLRAREREAGQGRRHRGDPRDRGRDPHLPLERARGAGRDRRRGPRGAGPAAARHSLRARPRPGHRAAVLGVDRAGPRKRRRPAAASAMSPAWASRSTKRPLRPGRCA